MTTRHDVSTVEPQNSYTAKWCPVRIQNDVLAPAEPAPLSEAAALRIREGKEFEIEVLTELSRAIGDAGEAVFVDADLGQESAIAVTGEAMNRGAEMIAGGWLPIDEAGRRTGKPDLLVRQGGGYLPVDIKHHRTLEAFDDASAVVSPLSAPFLADRRVAADQGRRKSKADALQLAHYRRMLEAAGFAAAENWAGTIGKERQVVWYDLDEPLWSTPAKSDGKKRKRRTSMEVYDFEFAFRLDIAAVAHQAKADPDVPLLVEPVSCRECDDCPWRDRCAPLLAAGWGDPSLLPGIGYRPWRLLRDHGITDRRQLADLDLATARLGAAGVDASRWLDRAAASEPNAPLSELDSGAGKQRSLLTEHGLATAGDVLAVIDPITARLGSARFLPDAIIHARAAIGPAPVYRLPGRADSGVPRAAIEIDVDMENVNDGVYLWGALVTDRAETGLVTGGYRPFITWEPLDQATELALFVEFWAWLNGIIAAAGTTGDGVRVYCWYEKAETTQMKRIAAADPDLEAAVAGFIDSPTWVDLYTVFKDSWTTGESAGLKAIAPLAGYEWAVDDPGGALSMVRYREATDPDASPTQRETTRTWLLDYNRGDVEATRRIREWLDSEGTAFPEVARIDAE